MKDKALPQMQGMPQEVRMQLADKGTEREQHDTDLCPVADNVA